MYSSKLLLLSLSLYFIQLSFSLLSTSTTTLPPCSGAGTYFPNNNSCLCDIGFMGSNCSTLDNSTVLKINSGCQLYNNGWHVWGSDIQFDPVTKLWHMVASLYPLNQSFFSIWLFDARIIHSASENYWGPFCSYDNGATTNYTIALDHGSASDWDRSIMNPKLLYDSVSSNWLLFYVGDTYNGSWPIPGKPLPPANPAQASQRIGVAYSSTPSGPYNRLGYPILEPRPNKWDSRMVTNPTITIMPNNSFLMVYKASNPASCNESQTQVCFGLARADSWKGPWIRVRDDPILPCPLNSFVAEDPTLWYDKQRQVYQLIFKDFQGTYTHAGYSGAHAVSVDGYNWEVTEPALAYITTHTWDDGKIRKQQYQERPQIVLSPIDHQPLGMTFATSTGLNGSELFWNMIMPVRPWVETKEYRNVTA